jgi:CelD/BcsL family acetyltransferase involved in cellulose biosynthesis
MPLLRTRICANSPDAVEQGAWDALTARPPASLCGSRAWFTAAFAVAHPEAQPLLVTVEREDRLVGLLPLAVHEQDGRRVIRFAGAPHNDLNDVMSLEGCAPEAAAGALDALCRLHDEGYELQLGALDPDGALAATSRLAPGSLEWTIDEPAPIVDLHGPWRLTSSNRRRKQWERKLRRLREAHTVDFRSLDGSQMLDELAQFARLREARRLATSRAPDLPPVAFFEEVVRGLCRSGRCAFFEMLVDGVSVARALYLLDRAVAMMWLRALDPAWGQFPCGHLLLRETAESLVAAGYETLDLGRGAEPYKFFFGARGRDLLRTRARSGVGTPSEAGGR